MFDFSRTRLAGEFRNRSLCSRDVEHCFGIANITSQICFISRLIYYYLNAAHGVGSPHLETHSAEAVEKLRRSKRTKECVHDYSASY